MRLRKLVLHGFKSFADRTEFVFDAPITAIVGPNGCGKSNVVDAVKWVLGEQSARSLRGDAMMDVIFNGSATRKPGGMAEVVLTFDNPLRDDGTGTARRLLPIESDVVSVGRRLYRDGTSEYMLNQRTARLRDIRELFLDTGIGVDAYSVIEQGRVAQLLEADPQERRQIFEEAAGISKFKQRRKEALRKLEKVDQNLLRVTDVVDEVERRLRGVRIQAGRARVYQEYRARLDELRLQHALREYHVFRAEREAVTRDLAEMRFRLDDATADMHRAEAQLEEARENLQLVTTRRQQVEYQRLETVNQLQQNRQQQEFARRQISELARQLEAVTAAAEAAEQRASVVAGQREEERRRVAALSGQLDERREELRQLQEAYRVGQLQLNESARELDAQKARVFDAMRQHALIASRLGSIESERRNLSHLRERLTQRRSQLADELATLTTRGAELHATVETAAGETRRHQADIEAARAEAARLGEHLASLTERLSAEKEHRSAMLGRQRVLQDLERRQQGVSDGVRAVLARRESEFPFVLGLVADVLEVDIEHARVIEAALAGRDQWLVVSSMAETLEHAGTFAKLGGRVNFVSTERPVRRTVAEGLAFAGDPADEGDPTWRRGEPAESAGLTRADAACPQLNHGSTKLVLREPDAGASPCDDVNHFAEELAGSPVPVRVALDLVRFEPRFQPVARRLLSRVAVVNDLLAAEHLRQHGPAGWKYVTLAGEVLDSEGSFHAGPPDAVMGLLSRRSELQQLAMQLAEADARIAALTAEMKGASEQARLVELRLSELRKLLYEAGARSVEASSQLTQLKDRLAAVQRESPLLESEMEQLDAQLMALDAERQQLTLRRQEMEASRASADAEVHTTETRVRELTESLKAQGEQLAHSRVAIAQLEQQHISARNAEARLTHELSQCMAAADSKRREAQTLEGRSSQVRDELDEAIRIATRLDQTLVELETTARDLENRLSEAARAVETVASEAERLRQQQSVFEQDVQKLTLRDHELAVRLETCVTRVRDELSVDLPARYLELEHSSSLADLVADERDWTAVAREIAELREKLQRLGNVNLDAIGEQEELEKRAEFLARELQDLRESKRQLESLIQEINRESSVRFMQTFELVREHFQGMFRKLFGGGKADLYLETELSGPQARADAAEDDAVATATGASPRAALNGPASREAALNEPAGTPAAAASAHAVEVLDAGIEIIARPPGKQPVRISQLSGGEKTMTCVALLLSIFKSKPSPFCILDEVDAALDEANNQRFNHIVQEFLDRSQFVIITHSKKTMTIADQLYGITQQEQGVSRRVSVRFDQVAAGGRIDPRAVEGSAAGTDSEPAEVGFEPSSVERPAVAGRIGPEGPRGVSTQPAATSHGERSATLVRPHSPLEAVGS